MLNYPQGYNEPSPGCGRSENTQSCFFNKLQRCVCGRGDGSCELKTDTTALRCHCAPMKMAMIKMTSVGQEVEKLKPLYAAGRNIKWAAALENSLAVLQMVKHRITI